MMESGGLFDRTLMVNPGPSRLFPEVQAEKIKELEKYCEKNLKLIFSYLIVYFRYHARRADNKSVIGPG